MAVVMRRAGASFGNLIFRPLLPASQVCRPQIAGIISKALRDEDYQRPIPFPYKERDYGLLASFFDQTTWRFDENTKVIVVDGPIASGKAKLAKELADKLDMYYVPHAHLDALYINPYGYDMRQLNDRLPACIKSFDVHQFLANPKDKRAAFLQINFFTIRVKNYIHALEHLFSTGQGVVLDRSIYSDFVFLETYHKFGFLSDQFKKYYYLMKQAIMPDLMRPHLVVYLDTPVDVIQERIKKRNKPGEIGSPALKPDVLKYQEDIYKQKFLREISEHAELLVYDNSEELDSDLVIEDIETVKVDVEDFWVHDTKMSDWRLPDEAEWNEARMNYSKYSWETEIWTNNIPFFDCPEILMSGEEYVQFSDVWFSAPGMKYLKGFNKDMGDPGVLSKLFIEK